MKKLVLASAAALMTLGVAACSDSGQDNTTTQSTTPPAAEQPTPANPSTDNQMKPDNAQPAQPAQPAQ